jgi:Peptidase C80 family
MIGEIFILTGSKRISDSLPEEFFMPYTNTWILLITDGTGGDFSAESNASKLKEKGNLDDFGCRLPNALPSNRRILGTRPNSPFEDGPVADLGNMTVNDRLYIVGHGTHGANPTLGSLTPQQLANLLSVNNLPSVSVISLISCNSGFSWGWYNSFASLFAAQLTLVNIHTEIRARIGYVTVLKSGKKVVEFTENNLANKLLTIPKGYNKLVWNS